MCPWERGRRRRRRNGGSRIESSESRAHAILMGVVVVVVVVGGGKRKEREKRVFVCLSGKLSFGMEKNGKGKDASVVVVVMLLPLGNSTIQQI